MFAILETRSAALVVSSALAADEPSCRQTAGAAQSSIYVDQCLLVSPPPIRHAVPTIHAPDHRRNPAKLRNHQSMAGARKQRRWRAQPLKAHLQN
jgi:hypothetical protein